MDQFVELCGIDVVSTFDGAILNSDQLLSIARIVGVVW